MLHHNYYYNRTILIEMSPHNNNEITKFIYRYKVCKTLALSNEIKIKPEQEDFYIKKSFNFLHQRVMDACQESDWSPTEAKSKKIWFLIFSNIKTDDPIKGDN